MGAPVMYTMDDPGAPTPTYAGGSVYVSAQNWLANFRAILRACLITGYGNKPAAGGWTIESEGPYHLLIKNGPGSGYAFFRLVDNGANATCEIFLAQTVTAVVDGTYGKAITGSGIKSGINPMISNESANYAQRVTCWGSFGFPQNTNWMLVADDKTFIFLLSSMESSAVIPITQCDPFGMLSLYVGEDTGGNFISVGGCNSNSGFTSVVHRFRMETTNENAGCTILKNPQTGALLTSEFVVPICPNLYFGPFWAEEYTTDRITLGKLPWQFRNGANGAAPYIFCGNLRGIAWANEIAGNFRYDYNLKALGWTGAPATLRYNPKLPLDSTYDYRMMFIYRNSAQGGIMTDNPAFW